MNSAQTSKDTELIILAVPTQKSQAWGFTCVLPNLEKTSRIFHKVLGDSSPINFGEAQSP